MLHLLHQLVKEVPVRKAMKIIGIITVAVVAVVGIVVAVILHKTVLVEHPELEGKPEIGEWYRISPEGTKSSDSSEWHGLLKLGTENKVAVYFFGGGVSINGYTSERGKEFFATTAQIQDFVASGGISSDDERNPFKDWTFLVLPYASGDFHSGTGTYRYMDGDQEKAVYHNGYENYSAFMEAAKYYVGEPDTLLVTGFSAGGFATSLLADDVIDRFPSAENVTVNVDSALLLYDDWHETATDLWQSPKVISDRLTSNNLVLDSLTALHQKRGDSVKILFDCSYRDDTLQQYQEFIRNGAMNVDKESGDRFQKDLAEMVSELQKNIPNIGVYIWNYGADSDTGNTQHTIISSNVFDELEEGKSVAEWIHDAVNGKIESYGLDLLHNS
ncbi:pectin acetylesterase [Bifidobacterium tsurumiense]|nr:pectin acetylesterase [Bifidobacterium tsurumiense]